MMNNYSIDQTERYNPRAIEREKIIQEDLVAGWKKSHMNFIVEENIYHIFILKENKNDK